MQRTRAVGSSDGSAYTASESWSATMQSNIIEEWHPVTFAPEHYEVSNLGRVRRASYAPPPPRGPDTAGQLLRPWLNPQIKYLVVGLGGKRRRTYLVHSLVAHAFLEPKPTPEHTVNHIDGVRTNNYASNLEWATHMEQTLHAVKLGRMRAHPSLAEQGEKNPQAKLTDAIIRVIRYAPVRFSHQDLAELFNVSPSLIGKIRARRTWKHVD